MITALFTLAATSMGLALTWHIYFLRSEQMALRSMAGVGHVRRSRFGYVKILYVSGEIFTDTDAEKLAFFAGLRELQLDRVGVTLRGTNIIARLPTLRSLWFWHQELGNDAMRELMLVRSANEITLRLPKMNGVALAEAVVGRHLRKLTLRHPDIEELDAKLFMERFPHCTVLVEPFPPTAQNDTIMDEKEGADK